jgi:aquaporin Z
VNAADRPLHGAPVPHDRLHPKLYLAEFAGTALLVYCGLSLVIAWFGAGSPLPALVPSAALRRRAHGACFGTVGALVTGDCTASGFMWSGRRWARCWRWRCCGWK